MKEWIGILFVAVIMPAQADWEAIEKTDSGTTRYVDWNTLRSSGRDSIRRIWLLVDMQRPNNVGTLSYRSVEEMDCKKEKIRILQATYFTGPMATGEVTSERSVPSEARYVVPGSVGETILMEVCKRRPTR